MRRIDFSQLLKFASEFEEAARTMPSEQLSELMKHFKERTPSIGILDVEPMSEEKVQYVTLAGRLNDLALEAEELGIRRAGGIAKTIAKNIEKFEITKETKAMMFDLIRAVNNHVSINESRILEISDKLKKLDELTIDQVENLIMEQQDRKELSLPLETFKHKISDVIWEVNYLPS